MKLRTEIQVPASAHKINHHQKIYLTGSCFSENIADLFRYFGFQSLANSHGIIYNPFSINQSLSDLASGKKYNLEDLELYNGRYFSYSHHGEFSSYDPDELLMRINNNLVAHRNFLKETSVVFVTIGTSWVYTIPQRKLIVANCHKQPSSVFEKDFMRLTDIEHNLNSIIKNIVLLNEAAQIVFTVSPVKHLRDGFVENQLSKSLLHVAIQNLLNEKVSYFPAYEIMNDDLRDYRFWKEDMMHPNKLAIDYIWEKVSQTYFDQPTIDINGEVKKLRQFLDHIPLSNDQTRIDALNADKETKRNELIKKYPQLMIQ